MTILGICKDALRLAVMCKPLWLFGFFIGLGTGGGGGDGGPGPGGAPPGGGPVELSVLLPILVALVLVAIAVVVMRLLSEGALIEGVARRSRGETLSVRQGFRDGAAHLGVVLLIKLVYVAVSIVSVVVIALPFVIAFRLSGVTAFSIAAAAATVLVAVPWLLTLYMWQAFALRIAVLENRRSVDAIRKARLFLHGRILLGLKLLIAMFIGTLSVVLAALVVLAPLVMLVVLALRTVGVLPLIVLAPLALAVLCVFVAVAGTFQSSVWTLGYLRQAEA